MADGHVLRTGKGTQVNGVVVPVALGAGLAVAADAHGTVATALGRHRPFVHHRPVARAALGDEHAEVLGSVAGILTAGPEAEGRTGNEVHLRRNKVVVGSDGLVRGIAVRTRADHIL